MRDCPYAWSDEASEMGTHGLAEHAAALARSTDVTATARLTGGTLSGANDSLHAPLLGGGGEMLLKPSYMGFMVGYCSGIQRSHNPTN